MRLARKSSREKDTYTHTSTLTLNLSLSWMRSNILTVSRLPMVSVGTSRPKVLRSRLTVDCSWWTEGISCRGTTPESASVTAMRPANVVTLRRPSVVYNSERHISIPWLLLPPLARLLLGMLNHNQTIDYRKRFSLACLHYRNAYINGWQHKGAMSRNVFSRKSQNTKLMCSIMWTYDICAADIAMYYDYYLQNHNIFQWCKQNTTYHPITGNKYSTLLCDKEANKGLRLRSTARIKTFVLCGCTYGLCAFSQVWTASIVRFELLQ